MKLKTFRDQYIFRPLQTIVIDKPFELDGEEMHLIALTYEDHFYSLWLMTYSPNELDEIEEKVEPWNRTNREMLKGRKIPNIRTIESLEMGETLLEFNSTSTDDIHFNESEAIHKLQYFIEKNVEFHQWDEIDLSKLKLTRHKCSRETPMLNRDLVDEKIKLNFRPYEKEAEVFYKYRVDFNVEKPVKLKYFNPFIEKEEYFYVHKFETYDLEDYISSLEEIKNLRNLSEEQVSPMREMMTHFFNNLKSKDCSLVLMTYEADRGLYFRSTEFLDRKIEMSSSNSTTGFFFKPDEKFGEYGKRLFIATFQEVSNDELNTIEFELHSVSKHYEAACLVI